MSEPFATLNDVETLFRTLTAAEKTRATALLPIVSDLLRQAAKNRGKNIDEMITAGTLLSAVVKTVTVDVVARVLRQDTTGEPMTQVQQSALGYSFQGTFAIPGGGIGNAIMNNDLKRLGIYDRQQIRVIETYDPRNYNSACGCDIDVDE